MNRPEQSLQINCVKWFNLQYANQRTDVQLFQIPNGINAGGKLSYSKKAKKMIPVASKIAKGMGLKSGVPDLQLLFKGNSYFFELKSDTGKLSGNQKSFGSWLIENNFEYFLIRSFDQFQTVVNKILK